MPQTVPETTSETTSEPSPAPRTASFVSLDPGRGTNVGEFPIMSPDAVGRVVQSARIASQWWRDEGFDGRRAVLLAWKRHIAAHMDELAELVHRENGKPREDALLEVLLSIEHLEWAARQAKRVLDYRSMRPGLLTLNQKATLGYEPFGVVAVIGPWNYPVFTPMGSIAYALAAGNAVVFKPSEWTTATGGWLVESFHRAVDAPEVLTLVTGDGRTGASLVSAGIDKVSFTGSSATGRKIMAACAETLTPLVLELGGKDALIVDEGANLDAAARAAAFGAFSNAGQTCVGVERVYVVDSLYEDFLAKLAAIAHTLRPGSEQGASYGPMTMPRQAEVVRSHVDDALRLGGRLVVGSPDALGGSTLPPVVMADVPESSLAVMEETFGPLVVVNPVASLDDAVERVNAIEYGLAATLFGGDRKRLESAARRLRVGMVSIGSWVMYAGVPSLPWGGVGNSGFGRIHGADGLREFARSKSVVRQRFAIPLDLTRFDRHPRVVSTSKAIVRHRHGRF